MIFENHSMIAFEDWPATLTTFSQVWALVVVARKARRVVARAAAQLEASMNECLCFMIGSWFVVWLYWLSGDPNLNCFKAWGLSADLIQCPRGFGVNGT